MMKSKNSIFFELTGKKDNEVFHVERFIKWETPNCIVIAITSDKFSWISWIFILIYSFEMRLLTQLLSVKIDILPISELYKDHGKVLIALPAESSQQSVLVSLKSLC